MDNSPSAQPVYSAAPLSAPQAVIPRATYRLQFHSGFTFAQATQLVPYLAALGVSHVYASPYLKARPGSAHGYDIVDHNALNPEIGSEEEYERFCQTLRRHGLRQILDVVPNHVGVMGSDNGWWLDVLENGQAAAHAPYFDIDWSPLNKALRDKVLVPILGAQYGVVLENGELRLAFDPDRGAFTVHYYDHAFPVDPQTYPRLLSARLEQLVARLGETNPDLLVYQSLITAFGHLPPREDQTPEAQAVRARDKEIHKRQLAELCRRSPDIVALIEETCQAFNGAPGDPDSFDALHDLLECQAYRLASWRVAGDDINYRRFFDINDLAALRMEDERVFRDTHRKILELLSQGVLHGLRIDHPDGLYDPKGYFQRLQENMATVAGAAAAGVAADHKPLYVVVEKILETYERLPKDWPVHGTTGYEFGNLLNGLLVDGAAEQRFSDIYAGFIGERLDFEELLYDCKKLIIFGPLFSELNVLANQLSRIALADRRTRDFTVNSLRRTLAEIVAHFPVYRTYITAAGLTEKDREYIDWAVSVARKLSQDEDVSVFDFIRDVLLTDAAADQPAEFRAAVLAFAMKFQQYTGPLMAKGLEDTSFYRYYRLVSLNEVGGDPRRFGVSVAGFHHANQQRVRDWPHAMLTTSTHDSKRSEDVRARIAVLSELPEEWERQLQRWGRLNAAKKRLANDQPAPSTNDEYLLYQILLGAWPATPLDEEGWRTFRARIENYMLKAVKEAKLHTSWIYPNAEYEKAVTDFVAALLGEPDKNRFLTDFLPLQQRVARFGLFNSLTQTLLKLTSPGVPDIYQGNELWNFSLVDPDNRRPVDYGRRRRLLEELRSWNDLPAADLKARLRELLDKLEDGRAKLYLTWRMLQLRRRCESVFRDGDYQPLTVTGAQGEHVCAFARTWENMTMVAVAPALPARLLDGDPGRLPLGAAVWSDTRLILPTATARRFVNSFDGGALVSEPDEGATTLPLAAILEHFPVAALVSEG